MSSKLLEYPKALCNRLRQIIIEAGEITLDYYEDPGCILNQKADGSFLTIADQKSEIFIKSALKDLFPDIPFIGEESLAEGTCDPFTQSDHFWLVDPLDGTKEFIAGSPEYSVNIALIYKGAPHIGLVYAPYNEDLYAGYGPNTAFKWRGDTKTEKHIHVRDMPKNGLTVMVSKYENSDKQMNDFLQNFKINKVIRRGSSLKICAIAAGKADLYPRFAPIFEWDIAAAHAILNSAGGQIKNAITGHDLTYGHNVSERWEAPSFIASGFPFNPVDEISE